MQDFCDFCDFCYHILYHAELPTSTLVHAMAGTEMNIKGPYGQVGVTGVVSPSARDMLAFVSRREGSAFPLNTYALFLYFWRNTQKPFALPAPYWLKTAGTAAV